MFALEHKRELSGRWGWMLASGIIDLILATIILTGLPGTAAWALGLLVGINMVFGGSALIAMALHAREIDPRLAAPAFKIDLQRESRISEWPPTLKCFSA